MKKPPSRRNPGQGSTEYIVILAVVLTITLVVIGLLGGFLGGAGDAQIAQSQLFWQSSIPVGISQHQDALGSKYLLMVVADNSNQPIFIQNVSVLAPNGVWGWDYGNDLINPGNTVVILITHLPAAGSNSTEVCGGSRTYQFNINISYQTSGMTRTLVSSKPIIGICGSAPFIEGNSSQGAQNAICSGNKQSCGQFCCPPGKPCCGGICCPQGWSCVSNVCTSPGN